MSSPHTLTQLTHHHITPSQTVVYDSRVLRVRKGRVEGVRGKVTLRVLLVNRRMKRTICILVKMTTNNYLCQKTGTREEGWH
jgi:hypothetical protein